MGIVGFEFTKIHGEKSGPARGKISIKNNISFKDVEDINLSLGKNEQKGLKFIFSFITGYEPKIGSLEIEGFVLHLDEEKVVKETIEKWKKDKGIKKELSVYLINNILDKCNIQALILSKELHLPSPIQLPHVSFNQGQEEVKEESKEAGKAKKKG